MLIVGAGSSGCVLANRLSADPALQVGLMEAGVRVTDPAISDPLQWPFLGGRPFDWAFRTVPQERTAGRVHDWPRGRGLGGSSLLHAMAHVRGHRDDFAAWKDAGGARWSFDGLLPAFKRSERFTGGASAWRGDTGPMPVALAGETALHPLTRDFLRAASALGVPAIDEHNAGPLAGAAPNQFMIEHGMRVTATTAYLDPASSRPNLTVLTGLTAERLVFDGTRAIAVETTAGRIAADRIVVAAGAIGSPLLLLRSGIGEPGVLREAGIACRSALPAVGRDLQDHLLAGVLMRARIPLPPSRLQHSESLLYLSSDAIEDISRRPDIVVACVLLPAVPGAAGRPGEFWTLLCGFCHPQSRGVVAPSGPYAADSPRIDPRYLSAAADVAGMRAALRMGRQVARQAPLVGWNAGESAPGEGRQSDAALDSYIARTAITHHHPAGTCALGSVVDSELRVRGHQNLYVVDASIMPTLPSGPIHAAVLAIAETFAADIWPRAA